MPAPRAPQRIDEVQAGFYRLQAVRNGPWIAARITIEGNTITLEQDTSPPTVSVGAGDYADLVIDAVIEGEAFGHPIIRAVWFGVRIERAEYDHLLRTAAWARANQPSHPAANPTKPIDLNRLPITDIF